VVQQLAQPEEDILERFGVDVVDLGRAFNTVDADWQPTTLADGQSAQYPAWFHPEARDDGSFMARAADGTPLARMPVGGTFFDQTCFPYLDGYPADYRDLGAAMGKVVWAALASSPFDHAGENDFWEQLRSRCLHLRATTDRAILVGAGCNLFEWGTFLRRLDNFCCDLLAEPASVESLLDALMERHLAMLAKLCEAVGDVADIVKFGDDLGTNGGPFMSPGTYRRFFQPRHAQLCSYVHQHSGMHTMLHSCGGIRELMPDLIAAGFEILNPVQTSCRGMEAADLKREFGRDLCFWGGGCDTRHVLPHGTPAEVREDVLRRLDIFMPGGGYVFNTVHNILPEVPAANVVAMMEAVREWGG
jgi:uroporphyrinogen decarboxylase